MENRTLMTMPLLVLDTASLVKESSIEENFGEVKRVSEGTMAHGIFASNPQEAKESLSELETLLQQPLPAGEASDKIGNLVFDDILFDAIGDAEDQDPDMDLREYPEFTQRLQELKSWAEEELGGMTEGSFNDDGSYNTSDDEANEFDDEQPTEGVNENSEDSPVAGAITRRIMMQRLDLLSKYGPVKVMAAIDEVADFVGDVEEIGSSDVSGWVKHVEQMLGNMGDMDESAVEENVTEDGNSAVNQILAKCGSGELDVYDVMTSPKTPDEAIAAKIIQQKYDDVSIDHHLHPDDQFEEILDIVCDQLEQDYGTNEGAHASTIAAMADSVYQPKVGDKIRTRKGGQIPGTVEKVGDQNGIDYCWFRHPEGKMYKTPCSNVMREGMDESADSKFVVWYMIDDNKWNKKGTFNNEADADAYIKKLADKGYDDDNFEVLAPGAHPNDGYESKNEGFMDTVKKGLKAVDRVVTGGDDEDLIKDLQRKMNLPQTGKKPEPKKENIEMNEELAEIMALAGMHEAKVDEQDVDENAYNQAAAAASRSGAKEFEFPKGSGKMHPAKMDKDTAHQIGEASKPDYLDLDDDGNKKEPMKDAAKQVDEAEECDDCGEVKCKCDHMDEDFSAMLALAGLSEKKVDNNEDKMDEANLGHAGAVTMKHVNKSDASPEVKAAIKKVAPDIKSYGDRAAALTAAGIKREDVAADEKTVAEDAELAYVKHLLAKWL